MKHNNMVSLSVVLCTDEHFGEFDLQQNNERHYVCCVL